jgi:VanZ family protein
MAPALQETSCADCRFRERAFTKDTEGLLLNERMKRLLRLFWCLAILCDIVASLLPADSLPIRTLDELALSDKIEHIAMYAVLALLPAIIERRRVVAAGALGAVALGVALEYLQLLSGWRSFEYADMAASAAGVSVGLAAGILLRTVLRREPGKHAPERRFSHGGLVGMCSRAKRLERPTQAMEQNASD